MLAVQAGGFELIVSEPTENWTCLVRGACAARGACAVGGACAVRGACDPDTSTVGGELWRHFGQLAWRTQWETHS